jgi:hypothetical protein
MRGVRVPRIPAPLPRRERRGSILVEFALVALVLYLLLAATFEFGRAFFSAQVVQQAADVAAREIARTPLPASTTIERLIQGIDDPSQTIPNTVYSEDWLVVDLAKVPTGMTVPEYFTRNAPIVNRLLYPLMIPSEAGDRRILQYPGLLVPDGRRASGFTVVIPLVSYAGGVETITGTLPVLQEVLPNLGASASDYLDPAQCPFSLTASSVPAAQRGLVAIRINCPYQAATLAATAPNPGGSSEPNFRYITVPGASSGDRAGPYAGPGGLGNLLVEGQNVRPFRRLLSSQAIYRREVIGP